MNNSYLVYVYRKRLGKLELYYRCSSFLEAFKRSKQLLDRGFGCNSSEVQIIYNKASSVTECKALVSAAP